MPQNDTVQLVWDPVSKQDVPMSLGAQPGGRGGLLQPPSQPPPETPERAAEMDTALESLGQGASTAMDVASLILPFMKGVQAIGPLTRMGIQSGLGAGSGALRGGAVSEPGLGGALEGALTGGSLEGSMVAAPKASRLVNKAAYRLGGFTKKEAGRAEGALNDVNQTLRSNRGNIFHPKQRFENRSLPVGAEARTDKLVNQAGQRVEASRAADPNTHNLWDTFQGAADPLLEQAVNTRNPVNALKGVEDELNKFIKQHVRLRGPDIPTAELGQLEVGMKHSPASKNLRTARDSKEIVTAAEQSLGQFDQAMSDASKGARYKGEGPNGPMLKADKEYAALKNVQGSNAMMRSPEMVTDPGKMAARGGLGAGWGRSLGTLAGFLGGGYTGGMGGALAGSALGNVLLSPTGLSLAGKTGASLMEMIPELLRAERALESGQDTINPNKVKLRTP